MSSEDALLGAVNPYLLHYLPADDTDYQQPTKRINSGDELAFFLTSTAYRDIKIWISQLARACLPKRRKDGNVQLHQLDDTLEYSSAVKAVRSILEALTALISEAPPDTGPRRFGNMAFRRWMQLFERNVDELCQQHLIAIIDASRRSVLVELKGYLLESFGSSQRLDYGTGHELNFLAFLGGLWKLGLFAADEQWQIVAGALEPYLSLVRTLIKTYTLEPAGSHGVWGLDDHSFIPYILGSAQLATPLPAATRSVPFPSTPTEGSVDGAPDPANITSLATVNEQRPRNFYFAAIGFILDVKKGPFFEHSPYLYNISGIKDGWGKINKGMLKMYDAEVLGKFPVVQHFPFGQLWQWERDPQAIQVLTTGIHIDNQPKPGTLEQGSTRAPWAGPAATQSTRAPWAGPAATQSTRAPWAGSAATQSTRAPWTASASRGMMPPPRSSR